MSRKLLNADIDFDNVARGINSLDPINNQDLVTKAYFEGLRYRVSAAQATTLNTYGNITQLVSAPLPVGNYAFRTVVRAQSAAANTGYGFRIANGSATVANIFADWKIPVNTDLASAFFTGYTQRTVTDNLVTGGVGSANTDYLITGFGFFSVTVEGTVAIQFRSENNGTAITVGIGSNLIIERLP
jgi:hypothetical protein